jgi:hypothetical protein
LAFGGLTVAAVLQHGYVGIFQYQLQSLAGLQVLADLGIVLLLVLVSLWRHARQRRPQRVAVDRPDAGGVVRAFVVSVDGAEAGGEKVRADQHQRALASHGAPQHAACGG